ncbi:MAG: hypothetical protein ABWZ77_07055, partial [Naasia sp.]
SELRLQDQNISFKANIAFIAKAFTIGNSTVQSGAAEAKRFSVIVPDANAAQAGPNCSSGVISTFGANKLVAPLAGMFYTPCAISLNNGTQFRGQLYGGTMSVSAGDSLIYVPVGIPGVQLGGATGSTGTSTSTGGPGPLLDFDDVAS